MPLRNKIKEFVDNRGLSVYRFERDTGIAHRTAHDLYNKRSQIPAPSVLTKICDAYQVQPGELLEWMKQDSEIETNESTTN